MPPQNFFFLLFPAFHGVGSEPWRFVVMVSAQASTHSPFRHLDTPCVGYGSWNLSWPTSRSYAPGEGRTSMDEDISSC